ncbi:electron transfer flavoprotein subunit alpha/FixB family protein [Haladaptatus sp. AB643]|uniref:electron transfer flavoprotein subunit alpha/FixB family protein n=1 Tax=Haladaptatus sp. AB643 TaxID=2934174 RepID=UPI00209C4C60|nr:electron transfer flavoprotein subunit alpha/FixB family protein [Haladaptatus sp. AB643]MCO8244061.1 electron transfer flavoprotein subunit alpha/FixB family protein [Haladaptatus sp. AB643]
MAEITPGERTVSEIEDEVRTIEDPGALSELLTEEEDGKDRKTAKKAIQERIDEVADESPVSEADGGTDTDDTETEGEYEETEEDVESPDEAEATAEEPESDESESAESESTDGEDEEVEEDDGLTEPTVDKKHVRALEDGVYRDMWVYCETQGGELLDVSREMLGKARELMDGYAEEYGDEERVVAVLVGDDMEELAEECITLGADVAVYHDDERLERFRHKPYTEIVADMARSKTDWKEYDKPRYFLFPATNNGRDLSAQTQAELDSGLASDCSGLTITDELISNPVKTGEPGEKIEFERILHMQRPDFSGFEYSTILCIDNPDREFHPQGCSVIPGSFDQMAPDADREGEVVSHDAELPDDWFRVEVSEWDTLDTGVDLTDRDVIVAVGRGIGDDPTEGIELALDLVDAFEDADLGLSRGVVTASYSVEGHVEQYVSEERQIGETGQVVQPPLYIAAGISGAIQHKVGMDESETIIAINTDTDADIRDFSDFFIEGDLFEVLPRLTDAVEAGELDAVAAEDDD